MKTKCVHRLTLATWLLGLALPLAGSEKPKDDSPSVSGDGLEAIDSAEISEAGPDIGFSGDSQESSPKVEELEEHTAPTPIELHDQETDPTGAGSTPLRRESGGSACCPGAQTAGLDRQGRPPPGHIRNPLQTYHHPPGSAHFFSSFCTF